MVLSDGSRVVVAASGGGLLKRFDNLWANRDDFFFALGLRFDGSYSFRDDKHVLKTKSQKFLASLETMTWKTKRRRPCADTKTQKKNWRVKVRAIEGSG